MARPSSIDRLPQELKSKIGELRGQGRTIDEILDKLKELDGNASISRSALHRHIQKADRVAERIKQSRVIAEVLSKKMDDTESGQFMRGNLELMHGILNSFATATLNAEDGEDGKINLSPQEIMFLTKSLDHLGKAAKDDTARQIVIEKRAAEKAKAKVDEALDKVSKDGSTYDLNKQDFLKKIREEVYGIFEV